MAGRASSPLVPLEARFKRVNPFRRTLLPISLHSYSLRLVSSLFFSFQSFLQLQDNLNCKHTMSREVVVLETTMGSISFELYTDHAPRTVANFRELARKGYYSGEQPQHNRPTLT